MKLTNKLSAMAMAATLLTLAAPAADAALQARPGGMVYDTGSDLTWLVDWNAAAGSAWDDGSSAVDGRMSWSSAMAWAEALDIGGIDDWRLPWSNACFGFGCRGSELGHLWYEVLGLAAGVPPGSMAPFEQVQSAPYWTGTAYAGGPGLAWYFNAQGGSQNVLPTSSQAFAVAVRVGDVATAVPEPATAWLALAGLALAAGAAQRRHRAEQPA